MAFVMAGGEGTRLRPLTEDCPKPALSFAGGYRIIDFVLSNLHNSAIHAVYVLVQYRPQSLVDHIARNWAYSAGQHEEFVLPVFPRRDTSRSAYRGTADAVGQNLHLIERHKPDVVAVFAADHIYRMDVRQMVRFHRERDADATVSAVPVPLSQAPAFGVISVDSTGKIQEFQEKPRAAAPMPGEPEWAFASMGNYLFRPQVLIQALREASERGETDFGQDVLPRLIATHRVCAYDFGRNRVPSTQPTGEHAYWRDVGNIEGYVAAHWDLLGPNPRFRLENREWPIFSGRAGRSTPGLGHGRISNSLLGPGAQVRDASLRNSVLQRGACVEPGAELEDCIIMDGVRVKRGARLRRTVVAPDNTISEGTCIGHDIQQDGRHYTLTPTGIVVVPPHLARSERQSALA